MFRSCLIGEDDPRNPAVLDERERVLDEREASLAAREKDLKAWLSELEEGRRELLREKQRLGLAEPSGEAGGPSDADEGAGEGGGNALEGYPDSGDVPVPLDGACYLVYESDSSGRLVEYYSKTPIRGAIGRWTTCGEEKISGFKFRNTKGNVIIASCSGGAQGRKNYCSGWCQFLRAACKMESVVMTWDPPEGKKGLPVDIWVYTSDKRPGYQSVRLQPGLGKKTSEVLAIACLPKGTQFYDQLTIDIKKWISESRNLGGCLRV